MCERFPQQSGQFGSAGEKHPSSQEVSTYTLRERLKHTIGALASRITGSKVMSRFTEARERRTARKLEKYRKATEPNRYWAIGRVAHDVAYGLSNSSSDLVVNVPSVYPISPALLDDHRQVLKEMNDPGYHDRIQRMLDAIDDNDESQSEEVAPLAS